MGRIAIKKNGQNRGVDFEEIERKANRPETGSTGSADTKADNQRGRERDTDTIRGKEEKEKLSRLADVEKKVETTKPKAPRKTRAKKNSGIKADDLSNLIVGLSGGIGSKKGLEFWLISKEESDKIAEPLANILNSIESVKEIGKHSDAIALTFACVSILMPRLIMTFALLKQKKEREVDTNVKTEPKQKPKRKQSESRQDNRSDGVVSTENPDNIQNDVDELSYFGQAIAL